MAFSQGVANKVKTEREAKHIRVKKEQDRRITESTGTEKEESTSGETRTGQYHCLTITV